MKLERPNRLRDSHWQVIEAHAARVANQLPGDTGGLVGACKELVECVAKVALTEATSPELDDFPKLVKKASSVLGGVAPQSDGDKHAANLAKGLAMMVGATETAAQGLSELRNEYGSGHGHAKLSVIAAEDVQLVCAYVHAWCTWALARLERLLTNSVTTLIDELTGNTFQRGLLRKRMQDVGFDQLGFEDQERLGFAVAERGARRETFVVAQGGLDPLDHDGSWPLAYQYGVAKGLLLTADGRLLPTRLKTLGAVLQRLSADLQQRLIDDAESAVVPVDVRGDSNKMEELRADLDALTPAIDEQLRARWDSAVVRPFFLQN